MKLRGARIATGPDSAVRHDIAVSDLDDAELDLSGHLLLPGLINAHDHLEFNLFPRLGNRLYANAGEWAADIYRPDESPVREQLSVPKAARLTWGALRNLLSGVTTVAHHNPYDESVFDQNFPVRVLRRFGWAHSLEFAADIAASYRDTPEDQPFIIHAAEGVDAKAGAEIRLLDESEVLGPRTVLVHALAAGPEDIKLLQERGCSIVWCPGSNLALFGRTLSADVLNSGIPIALGTDSALTFAGDMADELRTAHSLGVAPAELYRMVTSTPASILGLENAGVADFVAVIDRGQTPAEALLDLSPRMVMLEGRIKLLAADLDAGLPLSTLHLEGRGDYLVDADLPWLHAQASQSLGPDYMLAGKRVAA